MTHSYIVDGITCNGCVAKVKSHLLHHPDVQNAEVTLEGPRAVITMKRHIALDELQEAIGKDTKYKIKEEAASPSHQAIALPAEQEKTWLETYKPLLIIAVFITGVSVITAGGSAMMAMNHFMAGFFLVFSFFKLLDLAGFASSYAMYDLVAKKVPVWGWIYPFVELVLGIAYLTGINPVATNWATIIVMGVSSIGVIQSVISKQKIQCACLGAVFNLPMSTVTIIEDLLMVGMAAGMIVFNA